MRPALLALALAGCATVPPPRPICYVFVMPDCPIANAYAPEIARIAADFPQFDFTMVYVDGDEATARRHASDYRLPGRVVVDANRALTKSLGATIVPEAAIVGVDGRIAYRGRIDDRFPRPGVRRWEPTTRDLRDALAAVVAGRTVAVATTEAVGCFIPEVDP